MADPNRKFTDKSNLKTTKTNRNLAPVSGDFVLHEHIPYCLARCANRISHATFQKYKAIDEDIQVLNHREFRSLIIVATTGSVAPAEIAQATGMDRATVTRAIKTLKEKGMLIDFINERDGRSKYLVLTKAGAERCEKIIPVMQGVGEVISSIFTDDEAKMFKNMLSRVFEYAGSNRL